MLLRSADKANMLALIFGENQSTLRSTIECLRDMQGADLLDKYHSEMPLFSETFGLHVFPKKGDTASCWKKKY